jgi:AraC-like DNA-binding protein
MSIAGELGIRRRCRQDRRAMFGRLPTRLPTRLPVSLSSRQLERLFSRYHDRTPTRCYLELRLARAWPTLERQPPQSRLRSASRQRRPMAPAGS